MAFVWVFKPGSFAPLHFMHHQCRQSPFRLGLGSTAARTVNLEFSHSDFSTSFRKLRHSKPPCFNLALLFNQLHTVIRQCATWDRSDSYVYHSARKVNINSPTRRNAHRQIVIPTVRVAPTSSSPEGRLRPSQAIGTQQKRMTLDIECSPETAYTLFQ